MPEPQGITGKLTSYGDVEFSKYLRRAFFSSAGLDGTDFDRPLIGIIDTSSDYTTCHRDMPGLVQAVRRGVLQAGGLPLVCPTLSLGETIISPTAMLYRNLLAMETEEAIRAYPMDGVVLVGGCDKNGSGAINGSCFGEHTDDQCRGWANAYWSLGGTAYRCVHGLSRILVTAPVWRVR